MPDPLREALGANPTCEVNGDTVIVRLPNGADMVTFTFEEVSIRSQKFDAVVTVDSGLPGYEGDIFRQHLSVASGTNVNSYRLALEGYFGKVEVDWKRMLPKACQMAQSAYISTSRMVAPEDVADALSWWWHVERLYIGNRLNIVFGQGESAKSYLVQAQVMSAAASLDWAGRACAGSNWIWLDYENPDASAFKFRWDRLVRGGIQPPVGSIHWMSGRGIPIADLRLTLLREIARVEAHGIVVDSLTFGCGGDPIKPEVAQATCNALNSLDITALAIAHVTKDENADKYPFGSILWHLGPHGLTWNLKRVSEEGSDEIVVGWFNRKASDGGRQKSFAVRMTFEGETGPVTLEECRLVDTEFAPKASTNDRIWKLLERGKVLESDMADELEMKRDSVRRAAERMRDGGLIVPVFQSGQRYWARKARYDDGEVV